MGQRLAGCFPNGTLHDRSQRHPLGRSCAVSLPVVTLLIASQRPFMGAQADVEGWAPTPHSCPAPTDGWMPMQVSLCLSFHPFLFRAYEPAFSFCKQTSSFSGLKSPTTQRTLRHRPPRLNGGGWGQTESFLLEVPVNAFSQRITCFLTNHAIMFLSFSFSKTMHNSASHS